MKTPRAKFYVQNAGGMRNPKKLTTKARRRQDRAKPKQP